MSSRPRPDPVSSPRSAAWPAWKLFLRLSPDSAVLCLGDDCDHLGTSIAPHVQAVCALSHDREALAPGRKRFRSHHSQHEIHFVTGEYFPRLPFADASFDCIVGSRVIEGIAEDRRTWNRGDNAFGNPWRMIASQFGSTGPARIQRAFLVEIRRILKPHGQVFFVAGNRTSYEHLLGLVGVRGERKVAPALPRLLANFLSITAHGRPCRRYLHTSGGYRRLLRSAGFPRMEVLKLLPDPERLMEIRPADDRAKGWRPAAGSAGWRHRIKSHERFAPGYGIIAEPAENPSPHLLARILQSIAANTGLPTDSGIEIEKFEVRNTEKLILWATAGKHPVIIRLPLSDAAAQGLRRNWRFLRLFSDRHDLRAPRPVCSGEISRIPYFVEQRLTGAHLLDQLRGTDRDRLLGGVEQAMNALNPALETERHVSLTGSRYQTLVQRPLDLILAAVEDHELRRTAQDALRGRLFGLRFRSGIAHGDFNIANLLVLDNGSIAVFDWEAARVRGIPAVDAVNYLDAMYRHAVPGKTMVDTIRLLMEDSWPNAAEHAYLRRQASRSGVDPQGIPALSLLFWLHRIEAQLTLGSEHHASVIEQRIVPVLRDLAARPVMAAIS